MLKQPKVKLFINNAFIGAFTWASLFTVVNGMAGVKSMSFVGDKVCFVERI